ncbi:MAG: Transposase family protein [Chthoniobacter sp.]|nr:Transposase family protein [Chthoniobacter sp.]
MAGPPTRKVRSYPTDVSNEEWEFCAAYLTLMRETAPQRDYLLRAIFNALRRMVRGSPNHQPPLSLLLLGGLSAALLPHDLPPWTAVHQQTLRWVAAQGGEASRRTLDCFGECDLGNIVMGQSRGSRRTRWERRMVRVHQLEVEL